MVFRQAAASIQLLVPKQGHSLYGPFKQLEEQLRELSFDDLECTEESKVPGLALYSIAPADMEQSVITAYQEYRILSVANELNRLVAREGWLHGRIAPRIKVKIVELQDEIARTP